MSKEERQKAAAKRTRGNFVSVYQIKRLIDVVEPDEAGQIKNADQKVLVQVIDENAACSNVQEAKQEIAFRDIIGDLVVLRRTGPVLSRAVKTVVSFVEPKSYEGFSEAKVEPKTETAEEHHD